MVFKHGNKLVRLQIPGNCIFKLSNMLMRTVQKCWCVVGRVPNGIDIEEHKNKSSTKE